MRQDYDTRIDRVEKVVECPKLGGLSEVGAPHPKGRANNHTTTLFPERGAQIHRFFRTQSPAPGRLSGSSAAPQRAC